MRSLSETPGAIPLAALSIFHADSQKMDFTRTNKSAIAVWIVEFFQWALAVFFNHQANAIALIEHYRDDLLKRYRDCSVPGLKVVILLLLIEILRVGLPDWPFGEVTWVCGALECSHPLCRAHRDAVLRALAPQPGFAALNIAQRNVFSYTLGHTATLGGVLGAITAQRRGRDWLDGAAARLLSTAEELRDALPQAGSARHFYAIQHEIMAFAPAAELLFGQLSSTRGLSEQPGWEIRRRCAEEIKARAQNAIQIDFEDAVDLSPLLSCRANVNDIRRRSSAAAEAALVKYLYDETMFPVSWKPLLSGVTDEFPPGESANAGITHRVSARFRNISKRRGR